MARILATDADRFQLGDADRERLREAGIELAELAGHDPGDVADAAADVSGLLVYHLRVDVPLLDKLPECRVVARCGSGYDNIDVAAARARRIVVTYVPGYGSADVAEHALALLLTSARRITVADRAMRAGRWPAYADLGPLRRLTGRTLGLLGFGQIAREIAIRARCLGLRVVAHDPYVPDPEFAADGVAQVTWQELLADSDILSIHVPLTPETSHLIDEEALARIRPGALIINTSRGGIIDEKALAAALSDGRLGGAALDVFQAEPPPANHPLFAREDVVVTPHSAAFTEEALAEVRARAIDDVVRVLTGGAACYPVPEGTT